MASYEPTLLDIANLVDAPSVTDPSDDAPAIAHWLIRQSPLALEICEELHVETPGRPTLSEMANLLLALESTDTFPKCRSTAVWLLQQTEAGQAHYRHLEELVKESGAGQMSHVRLATVLANHETFQRLLAAGDDWNDPADVLDPEGQRGVDYDSLFHFCQAELARNEPERQRLVAMREKLRRCAQLQGSLPSITERWDLFQKWIEAVPDPGAMIRKLEAMLTSLRERSDSPAPTGRPPAAPEKHG